MLFFEKKKGRTNFGHVMCGSSSRVGGRHLKLHSLVPILLLMLLGLMLAGCSGDANGENDRVQTIDSENGFYSYEGYVIKSDFPMDEESLQRAGDKLRSIYTSYIEGKQIQTYFSIIPDKNRYMAELADTGELNLMDYASLRECVRAETDEFAEYIEIEKLLELSDYYKTDAHWRQECIGDVAAALAEGMGAGLSAEYEPVTASSSFVGAYGRQIEQKLVPEELVYLDSPVFDKCIVTDHESGSKIPVYDLSRTKEGANEGYDMFLGGARSLVTIENPQAATDRELIIFRDSFGSSLAPLLAEAYSRISLIDIRYLPSATIDRFVEFEDGQDVLFLFSTPVLNNSVTMK